MRIVVRLVIALVVLFGLVMGLERIAAESGEVVVLTTHDAAGVPQQTRLWIVDRDGRQWLRAGVAQSGWFQRLQADNVIELQRAGETRTYFALPDPGARAEIDDLMSQKYGWADRYIGFLFGRDASVPIGLYEAP